jgi:uncharacterized caspase-like protein
VETPAQIERIALVIGNSNYAGAGTLRNPTNDARAIAAALRGVGFTEVVERYDLPLTEMSKALKDFGDRVNGADWAVVYYAGQRHGDERRCLPVARRCETGEGTPVNDETIALDRTLEKVEGARRLKLVILDACRNNPFVARMARSANSTRSIGKGLPALEPEGVVLVAYATKDGTTAWIGTAKTARTRRRSLNTFRHPMWTFASCSAGFVIRCARQHETSKSPKTYGSIGGDLHFLAALAAH